MLKMLKIPKEKIFTLFHITIYFKSLVRYLRPTLYIRYMEVSTSVGGPHKMLWRATPCVGKLVSASLQKTAFEVHFINQKLKIFSWSLKILPRIFVDVKADFFLSE